MAVTKTNSSEGFWISIKGTEQEVLDGLENENIRSGDVATVFHDGTNYVAICRQGRASN